MSTEPMTPPVAAEERGSRCSIWPAATSSGGEASLWVAGGLGICGLILLLVMARVGPSGGGLVLLILALVLLAAGAGVLVLWLAYRQLRYVLGDEGLTVDCLGTRARVAYAEVEAIYAGVRLAAQTRPSGPYWPGIFLGQGASRELGSLRYLSTSERPADLIVIGTGSGSDTLVLSPANAAAFRAALIQRVQEADETPLAAPLSAAAEPLPDHSRWEVMGDPWARWTLAAALLFWLVGVAVLFVRYPGLPHQLPVRFNGVGQPTDIGGRAGLLRLPLGAAMIGLINSALGVWRYTDEAVVARVLWIAAVVVQALVLVAILRLA